MAFARKREARNRVLIKGRENEAVNGWRAVHRCVLLADILHRLVGAAAGHLHLPPRLLQRMLQGQSVLKAKKRIRNLRPNRRLEVEIRVHLRKRERQAKRKKEERDRKLEPTTVATTTKL